MAQNLPQEIQFAFTESPDHGSFCREEIRMRFVGNNAFWEPIRRTCGNRGRAFQTDQGQIYPLNGSTSVRTRCIVPAGRYPERACENGERKVLRGVSTTGYELDLSVDTQGSFSGGRLVMATKVNEDRVYLGTGVTENVFFTQGYEFRFSPGACDFVKISRTRRVDGRNSNPVSIGTGACRVIK